MNSTRPYRTIPLMLNMLHPIARTGAAVVELLGIMIIVGIALFVLVYSVTLLIRHGASEALYTQTRHRLARGILLGLEFLVAADIIHTVAVDPSFKSVGVLAIILVIRTFLSMTLELELTGRWPWQQDHKL